MNKIIRGALIWTLFIVAMELIVVVVKPQTLTLVADLVVRIRSLLSWS